VTAHEEIYITKAHSRNTVTYMNCGQWILSHPDIIYVNNEKDWRSGWKSRPAVVRPDAYSDSILGSPPTFRTVDGGTHIEGLKTVPLAPSTPPLGQKARKTQRRPISRLAGENIREGLTAVLS